MADTYNNLYLDARRALRKAGVEAAQLEARELLCCAAEKTREQLLRDMSFYAPDSVCLRLRELMDRRLAGEPIAYILGEWEFYGLTLDVTPDVLIPRADTETLVERALEMVGGLEGEIRVLDLCAGSGCVGLAIASQLPNATVVLADWSEGALGICRRNIRRCGVSGRVSAARVNALDAPPPLLSDFDLIVCNPPYIPTGDLAGLDPSVREYEPHMALDGGVDGLDFYRAVSRQWKPALREKGALCYEIGWDQAPQVEAILREAGYTGIDSRKDPGGHWRVVSGRTEE